MASVSVAKAAQVELESGRGVEAPAAQRTAASECSLSSTGARKVRSVRITSSGVRGLGGVSASSCWMSASCCWVAAASACCSDMSCDVPASRASHSPFDS